MWIRNYVEKNVREISYKVLVICGFFEINIYFARLTCCKNLTSIGFRYDSNVGRGSQRASNINFKSF